VEPHDDHLTLEWLAELLLSHPEIEDRLLTHLGAACGTCALVLQELKDLRARFKHWDACVVIAYAVAAAASARLGDRNGTTRWGEQSAQALKAGTSDPAVRDRLHELLRTSSPTPTDI
jgi:hypothetical protein